MDSTTVAAGLCHLIDVVLRCVGTLLNFLLISENALEASSFRKDVRQLVALCFPQ